MATSQFNPDLFLEQTFEGQNDTKLIPVPVGIYTAIIDDIKVRQWAKKDDPSISGLTLDVFWEIDSEALREDLQRKKIIVKQGIMLDVADSGGLAMGKGQNIQLGRLRTAVDLNNPGEPFSFRSLPGKVANVEIKHRVDGEDIYAEVKAVAHI